MLTFKKYRRTIESNKEKAGYFYNRHPLTISCTITMVFLFFLVSCQPNNYVNNQDQVAATILDLPMYNYSSVAWLNEEEIALAYREPGASLGTTQVTLYNLETKQLKNIIPATHPDNCFSASSGISNLARLPNGNLGYIYGCDGNPGGLSGELNEWDINSHQTSLLVEYPNFRPRSYSVSPHMQEVIQENPVGGILANELFRFQIHGNGHRILLDFKRAASPSWRPDGQSFIFAGTESTPFDSPETFSDVQDLALSSWAIYEMETDRSQPKELLPGLSIPELSWSPSGKLIAFSALYMNRRGIWLFDVESEQVSLIWESEEPLRFSWSTDGQSLIVLDREEENTDTLARFTYPTILDVAILTQP